MYSASEGNCKLINHTPQQLLHISDVQVEKFSKFDLFQVSSYHGPSTGKMPPRQAPQLICSSIEKANSIFDCLFELKRANEVGLLVIDECHVMFGQGHAAALETLVCKIKHVLGRSCVIVAMSATLPRFKDAAR